MVSTTNPETFPAVMKKVFDAAITAAEGAPGDFNQILDRGRVGAPRSLPEAQDAVVGRHLGRPRKL